VTLGTWLRDRPAASPSRLAARIEQMLGNAVEANVADAPGIFIATAEALLRDLLSRPSTGRDIALDLLTVDALVTYAFEAASGDARSLPALADEAMRRFAATVGARSE
jgi:hypothetical protein